MSGTTTEAGLPAFPNKTPLDRRTFSGSFAALIGTATLTGPGTVTITRADGTAMGGSDLALSGSVVLDSTSRIVVGTYINGVAGVLYLLAYNVTASDAEVYVRTATCYVTATQG